jgi:hypothetical protein
VFWGLVIIALLPIWILAFRAWWFFVKLAWYEA